VVGLREVFEARPVPYRSYRRDGMDLSRMVRWATTWS